MTETTTPTKDSLVRRAYGAATARVREAHRDEFNSFMVDEAQKLGVEWKPKPTEEEKAEAELKTLLDKHPGLAKKVAQEAARERLAAPPEAGEE